MSNASVLKEREQIILSSILFQKECKEYAMSREIKENLFVTPVIKRVIRAFNSISHFGHEPTLSLLVDQIYPSAETDAQRNARSKLLFFLKSMEDRVSGETLESFHLHMDVLHQAYKMKKFEEMSRKLKEMVDTHTLTTLTDGLKQIESYMEKALLDIEGEVRENEEILSMSLMDALRYALHHMREVSISTEVNEFVPSGYDEIDRLLNGGYRKGYFTIVAARPGMGKTVYMLNSAVESAKIGSRVLFVSIEMTVLQCIQRLIAKFSNISSKKIHQPKLLSDEMWKKLDNTVQELASLFQNRFWIEHKSKLTPPQLERKIKFYKKTYNIDIVFLDYAQILLTKEGRTPNEPHEFAEISGFLRHIAQSQQVAIVVGSQLNRAVENRNDKRPILADIRNSGNFEQDAAIVAGLYRDEVYYKENSTEPGVLEFIVLKSRDTETGTIKLRTDLDKQTILNQLLV